MRLIDSHCHIDDASFDADRATCLARATAVGVERIVAPAITAASWAGLHAVATAYAGIHPAYGLHPVYLAEHRAEHLSELDEWLTTHPAVAVGECGLDYYDRELDRATQQFYFEGQLELARKHDLPVVIHARRAVESVYKTLQRFPGVRGVLHSYAGSVEQAQALRKLGFSFGLGGPITWENARRPQQLARELSLKAILIETDVPDQPDAEHRGQRNEPAYLPAVAETLARLRGVPVEEVAEQTTANARALFGLG